MFGHNDVTVVDGGGVVGVGPHNDLVVEGIFVAVDTAVFLLVQVGSEFDVVVGLAAKDRLHVRKDGLVLHPGPSSGGWGGRCRMWTRRGERR